MRSVWNLPRSNHYYLRHPWMLVRDFWHNCKDAWSRAKNGFCPNDVWNFYDWYLKIIPDMILYLAEHGCGFPGNPPFETEEAWENWLKQLAANLILCQEEKIDASNEWTEEFEYSCDMNRQAEWDSQGNLHVTFQNTPKHEEISKKYLERNQELHQETQARLEATFVEMAKHFYSLWD